MKKVFALILISSSLLTTTAFAKMTEREVSEILAMADTLGRMNSLSILFDLANARKQTIPGLDAAYIAKTNQERVKLEADLKADLQEVDRLQSNQCYTKLAIAVIAAKGSALSSSFSMTDFGVPNLFSSVESRNLEDLRTTVSDEANDLEDKAQEACTK